MNKRVAEVGAKGTKNNQLNLIIHSEWFILHGPWHFEEDHQELTWSGWPDGSLNFDYLVNINGSNHLIYPKDLIKVKRLIVELKNGKSLDYHFHIISCEGQVKLIHGFGSLISDPAHSFGQPFNLTGELKNKNERLQKVIDAIPQMVWVFDVKSKTDFFNDRWYSYTGLTPEQCQGLDHEKTDIFHPSQKPEIVHKWRECIKSGQTYSGETLIKNAQGNYRWHIDLSIPIKDEEGKIEMWVGTFTDVHDQFNSEKKIRENQVLLEAILKSSINGIQLLDAVHDESSGEIIDFEWKYYNKEMVPRKQEGSYIGKRISDEYPFVVKSGLMQRLKEVVLTGNPIQFEQLYTINRHSKRWLDVSAVRLEDSIVLTFQDITDRKQAEIELRESKYFIQHIADTTPVFIYVLDVTNANLVYVNKRILNELGKDESFFYGQGYSLFRKIIHPDDMLRKMDYLQRLKDIQDDETREIQIRFKVADGSWRWYKVSVTLFKRKKNGSVWQTVGIAQDIHHQKKYDAEFNLHDQIDRQVERIANIGNWKWNLSSGEVVWGHNLFSLLEIKPKDKLPELDEFVEAVHPDDRERVIKELALAKDIEVGSVNQYDYRIVKKDGNTRYLRAISKVVNQDGDRIVIGTVRDVTQEVIQENEYRERVKFIETLIDSSVDRIIVYNKDLVYLAWNKKSEEFYNIKREDVLGKNVSEVFPGIAKFPQLVERMRASFDGEARHVREEYSLFGDVYQECFYIPLRNENNEVYAVLNILHDITQHIKDQQELNSINVALQKKNKELEGMNEQLSTFSFVASHDLREPLRKIQLFSNNLVDNEAPRLSDRGKEDFNKILLAVQRMNALIDDILAFSKSGTPLIENTPVDLNEVIATVKFNMNEIFNVSKAVLFCEKLPVVHGNRFQLIQLFQQLFTNAIKFQKPTNRPSIKITSKTLPGREINHSAAEDHKVYIILEVEDNGIGFEAQYSTKIFQMFQRLHGVAEFKGTGMGLAICKRIIENHRGFITAKSVPGKGSVFTCYFPMIDKVESSDKRSLTTLH